MKNFPHQINELAKLRRSLEEIGQLNAQGANVADDGILGYQLATVGAYTFRKLVGPLAQRIAAEQLKPIGTQGARTAAREIRRTLRYLGLIDQQLVVSAVGTQLLSAAQGSPQELAVWQAAIVGLELPDGAGNVSHPICILLRLVDNFGQLQREDMALVLEALDDSQAEFQRIVALVPARSAMNQGTLKVTKAQFDNSIKILPALAEHARFITHLGAADPYTLSAAGQIALQACLGNGPIGIVAAVQQPAAAAAPGPAAHPVRTLPNNPTLPAAIPQPGVGVLTAEQQQAAMRLRFERTARHQRAVKQLADQLRPGFKLVEGTSSFDVVALREAQPNEELLLLEVKTLDADAITQTRLAVGQLLYYEHVAVATHWPDRAVLKAVVFDGTISAELRNFLEWLGIGAFRVAAGILEPLNDRAVQIKAWIDARF